MVALPRNEGVVAGARCVLSLLAAVLLPSPESAFQGRTERGPSEVHAKKLNRQLPATGSGDVDSFQIGPLGPRVVYRAAHYVTSGSGDGTVYELFSVPESGGSVVRVSGPLVPYGDVLSFQVDALGARVVYRA